METQKFKGDDFELQMEEAGKPAFDRCSVALDEFYEGGFTSEDFLLMLYDEGRMPFSDRVPRDTFTRFIRQAIANAPFTGTFESYIFLLKSIFGENTQVLFDVPAAGKLEMEVSASDTIEFGFTAKEYDDDGNVILIDMVTSEGEYLEFLGISGIDTQAELEQLLSELIPVGIWTDITLTLFELSFFTAEDLSGDLNSIIDHLGNQIIFKEPGA